MNNGGANGPLPVYEKVPTTPAPPREPDRASWMAVLSLVSGILSIVFAVFGIAGGLVAVILSVIDRVKTGSFSRSARAGLICGVIGTLLCGLMLFAAYALYRADPEAFRAALIESVMPF